MHANLGKPAYSSQSLQTRKSYKVGKYMHLCLMKTQTTSFIIYIAHCVNIYLSTTDVEVWSHEILVVIVHGDSSFQVPVQGGKARV